MRLEEMAGNVCLTKKERLVLDFLTAHREEAAVMTSTELARAAGVGDTSVIRLSRTLGFDSFRAFRRFLQEDAIAVTASLNRSHLPYEKVKNADALPPEDIPGAVRTLYTNRAAGDLAENGDRKYLDIANLIMNADKKYIAGFRNTAGLADYFTTVLSHVLPEVRNVNRRDGFEDEAINMGERDVLLLFSLPRYSKNALTVAGMAARADCPIVAFTDSAASPVAADARYTVVNQVDSYSYANSVSSLVLSLEILITLIGKLAGERGRERLERLDAYLSETGLY